MEPPLEGPRKPAPALRGVVTVLLACVLWAMSGPRGHGEFSGEEIIVLRQALGQVVDGALRYPLATSTGADDPLEFQPVGFASDLEDLRDRIVNLEIDTLTDFTLANYFAMVLPEGLTVGQRCPCVDLDRPCGGCTAVRFSHAGFSADREQALVYVSVRGRGYFMLFEGYGADWKCIETLEP